MDADIFVCPDRSFKGLGLGLGPMSITAVLACVGFIFIFCIGLLVMDFFQHKLVVKCFKCELPTMKDFQIKDDNGNEKTVNRCSKCGGWMKYEGYIRK